MQLFQSEPISRHITRIRGAAGEIMYLIEGTKESVLVDTGCGFGDLKGYLAQLTNREVTVLLTHGHVDHAMGAGAFVNVYMNPDDLELYAYHTGEEFIERGLKPFVGENLFARLKPTLRHTRPSVFLPLLDGMVFSLGDVTLEVYDAKGHSKGSVAILVVEERMLIIGDACTANTLLYAEGTLPVEAYLHSLEGLQEKTKGRYDRMLFSHGSGESIPGFIESGIALCREILAGTDDAVPYVFLGDPAFVGKARDQRLKRYDGGLANIVYRKEQIWSAE